MIELELKAVVPDSEALIEQAGAARGTVKQGAPA